MLVAIKEMLTHGSFGRDFLKKQMLSVLLKGKVGMPKVTCSETEMKLCLGVICGNCTFGNRRGRMPTRDSCNLLSKCESSFY